MPNAHKTQVLKYGRPISRELYKELRLYAEKHRIKISGFSNYVGDIATIKTIVDDICEIADDFPLILDDKTGIVLNLNYDMRDDDYATTDSGHIIYMNASYFCDLEGLKKSYENDVKKKHFVSNTDWRAIIRHEVGHVVYNLYHFDVLEMAYLITGIRNKIKLFDYLVEEVSIYSTAYEDGREIISESFSGYYSKSGNSFANAFVEMCLKNRLFRL